MYSNYLYLFPFILPVYEEFIYQKVNYFLFQFSFLNQMFNLLNSESIILMSLLKLIEKLIIFDTFIYLSLKHFIFQPNLFLYHYHPLIF